MRLICGVFEPVGVCSVFEPVGVCDCECVFRRWNVWDLWDSRDNETVCYLQ